MDPSYDRGELSLEPEVRRRPRPWRLWVTMAGITCLVTACGAGASNSLIGTAASASQVPKPLKAQPPALVAPVGSRLLPASWQQPKQGWLYVLDPNELWFESEILLVDPNAGAVEGVVRTGDDPQMVLSPDGSRLYVASVVNEKDTLSVIDTATGRTLQTTALNNRKMDVFLPAWPTVARSDSGRDLLIKTAYTDNSGAQRFGLTVFDTRDQTFAPISTGPPDCPASQFLPLPAGDLAILCGLWANDLRLMGGFATVSTLTIKRVALPRQSDDRRDPNGNSRELWRLSGAAISSTTGNLFSITQNGKVLVVDRSGSRVLRTIDLGLSPDEWLPPKAPAISPDGTMLFVSVGALGDQGDQRATRILAIDTTTWKSRTFSPGRPFWSLTLAPDGSQLYALDPDGHAVVVLNPRTGQEIRAIGGVGSSPVMAIVAP